MTTEATKRIIDLTDRELDARIAAALGWTDIQPDCYTPTGREWCGTKPNKEPGPWEGHSSLGRAYIPFYSSSAHACMQLIEHTARQSWFLGIELYGRGSDPDFIATGHIVRLRRRNPKTGPTRMFRGSGNLFRAYAEACLQGWEAKERTPCEIQI